MQEIFLGGYSDCIIKTCGVIDKADMEPLVAADTDVENKRLGPQARKMDQKSVEVFSGKRNCLERRDKSLFELYPLSDRRKRSVESASSIS